MLARFYELRTNHPLYITKGTQVRVKGRETVRLDGYELSYSDESVILHYSVLVSGRELAVIEAEYERLTSAPPESLRRPVRLGGISPWQELGRASEAPEEDEVRRIIQALDERGAWVEEGGVGATGRIVSVFAARDMLVRIGPRILPLAENETLEVFEGRTQAEERVIRSGTFVENMGLLCEFLERTR